MAQPFTTVRTEGAVLPPDLLRRVQDGDKSLPQLTPASYHLPGNLRLGEAIGHSWNVLLGAWASFAEARASQGDPGARLTREKWLLPLFHELGYGRLQTQRYPDLEGKRYPISHGWGHVPIHLIGAGVDLDRRSAGVAGAARSSPHSLVQEFLNRSDAHLWGMVSNGLELRLLRDNASLTRQAYAEFDLEAMMADEVYADFVLLWLVCHESRVEGERPEDCVLEAWSRLAAEEGTRALEHLRDGVERAIRTLGQGFLQHPANEALRSGLRAGDLTALTYYRQLLRLVYQLLFLFVAEDRDLLHPADADDAAKARYSFYSTRRLRELADHLRGSRHADLYEALKVVMRALGSDAGALALGLPPLGGFLFSKRATPSLQAQLANGYLLQAVRGLAYVDGSAGRRPVDYKNLGSEELGSVYESLLELHPELDTGAATFTLSTAAGNERKTTGSYYTPSSLINLLLDSALEPVLNDAVKGKRAEEAEEALLNLKIVDPACGSGHFLIAAAQRLGKRLAALRTGDDEPAPEAVREAVREVIGRCVYGVDASEMAAELCKVALWLEALEPGKPLTFLEHRVRVGNSLLGTTPSLIAEGIPDDAYKPIEGDDKKIASAAKKRNREERRGQSGRFEHAPGEGRAIAHGFSELTTLPDDHPAQIRAKEKKHAQLLQDERYIAQKLTADAWCATFMWPKQPGAPPAITTGTLRRLQEHDALDEAQRREVERLAARYQFFHWRLAFPEVFPPEQPGGFDVVLGNPPWERLKIQEKEWFASRRPEVANARNASERSKKIRALEEDDPELFRAFGEDKRRAEGESHYVRTSGRYPLTGRGDVNTYPLFAELGRDLLAPRGRLGVIVPDTIATNATTQYFFNSIVESENLRSLYGFKNERFLFKGIEHTVTYALLTIGGRDTHFREMEFCWLAWTVEEMQDPERRIKLTREDFALLNPNTKTCPVFRSRRDAEITKGIYRRVPVLVNEATNENPWGIKFMRMLDMSNDSSLFRTKEQLEQGFTLRGNHFAKDSEVYLPLYEAKLMHQFDHRFATYTPSGDTRDMTLEEHHDPYALPLPRYWVEKRETEEKLVKYDRSGNVEWQWENKWLLGFRDIARNTDERTAIFSLLPLAGIGNNLPLSLTEEPSELVAAFVANTSSFVFDYPTRQKIAGTHMNFFFVKQLPILPPAAYSPADLAFITPRVLELSYAAWDVQPFALDLGCSGPPFLWDEERRFWLRCELDALYFHLYGILREDAAYIMNTFPIVKRKDEAAHGCYRTREAILDIYDEMAQCEAEGREFASRLDPAPANVHTAYSPDSDAFEDFIQKYQPQYPVLAEPAWQQSVRNARLRGKYPETPEEWLNLFLEVRDAIS